MDCHLSCYTYILHIHITGCDSQCGLRGERIQVYLKEETFRTHFYIFTDVERDRNRKTQVFFSSSVTLGRRDLTINSNRFLVEMHRGFHGVLCTVFFLNVKGQCRQMLQLVK